MDCVKEIYCLGCYCSCDDTITLKLEADSDGIWTMYAKFNGVVLTASVSVVNGENITIPNIFNENYTHTIWFKKEDESIFNNRHYSLKTVPCKNIDNG